MVQEFSPQTEMLNRLSQIPTESFDCCKGITILRSSQRNSYFTIFMEGNVRHF